MSYFELCIKVNSPVVEIVSDFLISEIGFSGVLTEDVFITREENLTDAIKACATKEEIPFTEEEIRQKIAEKRVSLKNSSFSDEDLGDWECSFNYFADEDWAEKWKEYWDVQKIGKEVVICPSWLEYEPSEGEIKISLDPGSAFGTGTHPTTRLCVRELEKYVKPDFTVADIGCGSGILSIAAKKLGASEVFGVDTDSDSVRVSIENAEINSAECIFEKGSADSVQKSYDVVVANILAHIIIDIMGELKRIAKPSGILIFSGIIEEKTQSVIDAMQKNGIELVSQTIEEGNGESWMCIVGRK